MDSTDIVVKTHAGLAEVKSRSGKLSPRLRTILIIIDGTMTVEQLRHAAAGLAVPPDFLESLQNQGLIAIASPGAAAVSASMPTNASEVDRFRTAQKLMNDSVVDALGFRALFFTLKVERCSTVAELRGLLDDYQAAIVKGSGAQAARILVAHMREMLGG